MKIKNWKLIINFKTMPDIKRTSSALEPQGSASEAGMAKPPARKKSGWGSKVLVIIIIIVVILICLFLVSKYTSWNILNVDKGSADVQTTGWQAVFLSNGQVYFGRVSKQTEQTLVLRDIYYLQVSQQIQPSEAGQEPQQNLSLVKLGNELHGPQDSMFINMDHVLFTEELKSDSRVVDAIKRYLEEGE